jgi:hypothetical protein
VSGCNDTYVALGEGLVDAVAEAISCSGSAVSCGCGDGVVDGEALPFELGF